MKSTTIRRTLWLAALCLLLAGCEPDPPAPEQAEAVAAAPSAPSTEPESDETASNVAREDDEAMTQVATDEMADERAARPPHGEAHATAEDGAHARHAGAAAAGAHAAEAGAEAGGHRPPIGCPLAEAGHDPSKMRPFDEVDEYIAFLERPERAAWQKPDALLDALALADDEIVVDLGAGSGYFAFRFAARLPGGEVEALDVEPEMVRHMHHKSMTTGVENLHAGFVDATRPGYRDDATLVFVCDVLHHVADPKGWIAAVAAELPVDARLVLVEFRAGELPQGPPEGTKIPRDRLVEMANEAGLVLVADHGEVLPYQNVLTFRHGYD